MFKFNTYSDWVPCTPDSHGVIQAYSKKLFDGSMVVLFLKRNIPTKAISTIDDFNTSWGVKFTGDYSVLNDTMPSFALNQIKEVQNWVDMNSSQFHNRDNLSN